MNKEKILHVLSGIVRINADELTELQETTRLADIGLNSIRFIRFVVAIEETFNIEILDSDLLMSNFETLESLYNTMRKYFTGETLKKVLICDCDNVLWNGVSGEEEIYLDDDLISFQEELVRLYESGILLCLCSKNEERNLDRAFETLRMPLKKEHFILIKANFSDKANNIRTISDELNLSTGSFVFVDDSDYEIGLINAVLSDVETVKAEYGSMVVTIGKIKSLFRNHPAGDLNRTQLYIEQKEREKSKLRYSSVEEYNRSLNTITTCATASTEQAERIAELSQRTNQFNLSGERYSKEDIEGFINSPDYIVLALSVSDKYGDMGIVGVATVKLYESRGVIDNFFLSCRVFGRDFEHILLETIKSQCENHELYGVYLPTGKNARFGDFYTENGVMLNGLSGNPR